MRNDFLKLLDAGVTSRHAAHLLGARLREAGFVCLDHADTWPSPLAVPSYTIVDGTLVAWRPGTEPPQDAGVVMLAAHSDQPALQLKHRSATLSEGFLRIPVEVYGGPIQATWLDRDLALAGEVIVRDPAQVPYGVRAQQLWSRRPMAVIPNLAIHLNREVNDSASYNRQDHLRALIPAPDVTEGDDPVEALHGVIAALIGVAPDQIVDMDVMLVASEPAQTIGDHHLAAPRIDNLAGAFTVVEALVLAMRRPAPAHGAMVIVFDHEEIGSVSSTGAAGSIARDMVQRFTALESRDALQRMLARTTLISNDVAHARHPNYPDKHDPGYAPRLGAGPVVKRSAVRRYASDLEVIGWFVEACRATDVPVQMLQSRSDMQAGSTIAPLASSRLGVRSIDIGVPLLSMHSIREHADLRDIESMTTVLTHLLAGPST